MDDLQRRHEEAPPDDNEAAGLGDDSDLAEREEPQVEEMLGEEGVPEVAATLEELKITQQFIEAIRAATLDNSNLDAGVIEQL